MEDDSIDVDDVEDAGTDEDIDSDEDLSNEVDDDAEVTESDEDTDELEDDPFDFDLYGDRLVTIKVDGEEIEVPLAELRSGYMRQADYTRKTQATAKDAEAATTWNALQTALARDFDGTVSALRQHFGIEPAGNEEILDPLERDVRDMQAWRASQEAERRQQAINAELSDLKVKDPDLDEAELLNFAIEHGVSDLGVAYRAYAFDRAEQKRNAEAEAEAIKQRKVEAKRRAAKKVAPATTRSKSGVAPGESDNRSLRELIADVYHGRA